MCNGENTNKDCNGDCFGIAILDDCGVCSDGLSNHIANSDVDCAGDCLEGTPNWSGTANAEYDECGVCDGGNANKDCAGECFGLAAFDDCGVCSGGTSDHVANSDIDCAGYCLEDTPNWNGNLNAEYDECGVCSGGSTGHEAKSDKDCAGECYG